MEKGNSIFFLVSFADGTVKLYVNIADGIENFTLFKNILPLIICFLGNGFQKFILFEETQYSVSSLKT
jgi:hypothetical protein